MAKTILHSTSHIEKTACEKLIKEIRQKIATRHPDFAQFEKASMTDKIIEDGKQYNRIRLTYRKENENAAVTPETKEEPKQEVKETSEQVTLEFDEHGFYVPENEEEVKTEIYNKAKYGLFGTVRAFITIKPEDVTIKFHKLATDNKELYYSIVEKLIHMNMTIDEKGVIYYHKFGEKYVIAWFDIKNRCYKKVENGQLVEIDPMELWAELRQLGKQVDAKLNRQRVS